MLTNGQREELHAKLTTEQQAALDRIRADGRLREYEFELMTDWAYVDSQEAWEWIARADVESLVEFAEEIREEQEILYGPGPYETTWEENIGLTEVS